jgi:hypothetical protein
MEVSGHLHASALLNPRKDPAVPIACAPELVWVLHIREKVPCSHWKSDCSTLVLQPVAYILILLSWFPVVCSYQKIKFKKKQMLSMELGIISVAVCT